MPPWSIILLVLFGSSTVSHAENNFTDNSVEVWCGYCQEQADMAVIGARLGMILTEQAIVMAENACLNQLHLNKGMCHKVAQILVPYLFDLIRRSNFTGQQLCAVLIPPCSNQFPLPTQNWSVALPPRRFSPQTSRNKPAKKQLNVLQLTDIHIDPHYVPGSAVNCASPTSPALVKQFLICCRGPVVGTDQERAGYWGTANGMCDLPYRTFESALRFLQRRGMKFDYILLTGDISPHDLWEYTKERSTDLLRNITATVENYFSNTPVYTSLGNHEAVPFDAFSYNDTADPIPQGWLYRELEQHVRKWIPEEDRRHLLLHGSYVSYPSPGLKIIHLNNNFCFHFNFFAHLSSQDPGGVLSYLVQELKSAEDAGELVHIHAHIAPSNNGDCLQAWTTAYLAVLRRFEHIVVEQFFGHNHVDRHLIYMDQEGRPMTTGWVAPSLTTWDHVNPAFRTYTVDTATGKVVSSSVFHAAVDGLTSREEPHWQETDTLSLYGLPDFSVNSWVKFMNRVEGNSRDRVAYIFSIYRNSSWIQKHYEKEAAFWLLEENIYVK